MENFNKLPKEKQAVNQIRRLLEKLYPSTKWVITSDSFSGGNGVRISWEDGPTKKEVEEITNPYQYGGLNERGVYDFTNERPNLPQVKYVLLEREPTQKTRQALIDEFEERWGMKYNNREDFHRKQVYRKFEETAY